jgi:hypothetical protein
MLQSFIVYGFLGLTLWWLGTIAAKRERINLNNGNTTPFWTWEIVFSLFLFATISGIRWNVGTDYLGYLQIYRELIQGIKPWHNRLEDGFLIISKIFARLNFHFSFYFSFWAFLQLFFVYYAFKNERHILPYLGLIILFGGQYLLWMNGIRQAIAACIFVFSIQYITNRKFIKYFLTIFFAAFFHKSAIVLVIFYFILNKDFFKNRYFAIVLVVASILIGFNTYWLTATDELSKVISIIGYDKIALKLEYIISERQKEMAFGPRRIVSNLIYIVVIWLFPKFKKIHQNKNALLYYNLTILGAIHYNLFANSANIFLRPTYYLTIFTPVIVSYLLFFLNKPEKKGISIKFIILFILSISYLLLSIIADAGKGNLDFTNYKFFWYQ